MKFNVIILAATAFTVATSSIHAEEGGSGHYVPGTAATLADVLPIQPGWIFAPGYLHYSGDASPNLSLPIGGQLAGDIDGSIDAFLPGGFFTFENPLWDDWWYSVGAFVPYVWKDVSADVRTPRGTVRRNDSSDGLGDIILLPVMLAKTCGNWQYNAMLSVYMPTGDYEVGNLANVGLNYWTFDPTVGISYSKDESGFNAAVFTGFAMNTENDDTDYKSGTVWHVDASAQQLFPVGPGMLGLGVSAFYYNQITGDSGSGSNLGDFKGSTAGIGPVLTYILPVGESLFVSEARWLPELDASRRLKGDYFWLKLIYQF